MKTKKISRFIMMLTVVMVLIANVILINKVVFAEDSFKIQSQSPNNGTEMVDVASKIIINFSDAVDKNSLDSTNFVVKSTEGTPTNIGVTVTADSSNPAKVIITPRSKLGFNKTYSVTVSKNVKSKSKVNLGEDVTWTFKTIRNIVSLSVEPSNLIVEKDKPQEVRVYAVYSDNQGTKEDVTSYVDSKSLADTIAVVDHNVIKAVKPGKTTINYSLGGKKASVNVKTVPSLDYIDVGASKLSFEAGKGASLKAKAYYKDKSSEDITSIVNWSTQNESIASVNRGTISIKSTAAVGSNTKIIVTYLDRTISIDINIIKPIKKLTANTSGVILPVAGSKSIKLTASFNDGSLESVEDKVTAISLNPSVAKVDGGIISAVSLGTTQIKFTYGSQSTTINVNVKPELKSLVISPDIMCIETGSTVNVKATATYIDGKTEDVTKYADWISSDSNKLTVLQGGHLC